MRSLLAHESPRIWRQPDGAMQHLVHPRADTCSGTSCVVLGRTHGAQCSAAVAGTPPRSRIAPERSKTNAPACEATACASPAISARASGRSAIAASTPRLSQALEAGTSLRCLTPSVTGIWSESGSRSSRCAHQHQRDCALMQCVLSCMHSTYRSAMHNSGFVCIL